MRTKPSVLIICGMLAASAGQAPATDVGATSNISALQAGVNVDGIINFNQDGTLTMNSHATGVETISVADGVTGTIDFGSGSSGYKIKFKDAPAVIRLGIGSQLTVRGTDADAGFDFATVATGKTLTITSSSVDSLGDAVAANRLLLGNGNTVVFGPGGGAADALRTVVIVNNTVAPPIVDVNTSMSIKTLTITTAGDDVTFGIAHGAIATIADGLTLEDDTILEVGGTGGTLHFTGGLILAGISTLRVADDGTMINGGVVLGPGTTVDADAGGSIAGVLELTGDAVIDVAAGKTLTATVNVGEHVLTLPSSGTISTVLLDTLGGVVDVDAAATISSLQVTAVSGTVTLRNGADLGGTVTVSGAGGRLHIVETGAIADLDLAADATVDIDASLTIGTLDLTSDATLDVAAGETLTVTNGLNIAAHTLTLSGAGTISRVDATSGAIVADGGSTIGELCAHPGVGRAFTFGGIGAASIDRLDTSFADADSILRKVGSGRLTLVGGLSSVFDNAIGVVVDVDEGTLAVGVAGAEDDIVFDDEVDGLTVADGATLTIYGDLALAIEVAGRGDVAVSLTTQSAGTGVLTLSDGDGSGLLTVDVSGFGPAGGVSVGFGADGEPVVAIAPADSVATASLQIDGVGVGGKVTASVDEATDQVVTLTTADGSRVRLALDSLPVPAEVAVSVDAVGGVAVLVTDGTSDAVDTTLAVTGVDDHVELGIAYNPPPVGNTGGRIVTGFWGFEREEALGGSVTISAAGYEGDGGLAVALSYSDHDASQVDETLLRLQRVRTNTGIYEPAGTHDVGVSQPTDVLGEYGVDPDVNSAWAVMAEGGTFAVGMPDDALTNLTIELDPAPVPRGGACGVVGMLTWSLTLTGLIALRRRTRQVLDYSLHSPTSGWHE